VRLDYDSFEVFEQSYQKGFKILENIIIAVTQNNINIPKLFGLNQIENSLERPQPYLILKYTTNYKKILRDNYQFIQWFMTQFDERLWYEEIDTGFLLFFERECDFYNSNLPRDNLKDIEVWLNKKGSKMTPEIAEFITKIFNNAM
jgi:bifunctional pyridoxal-dependent enzyme with beta-cystathionase and maltose regulon repressor activities